jgi:hypothetical protein
MRNLLRRRPSPAMVVACLALLVALGGTSYATVLNVPRNSVGTRNLKSNAVTTAKIRNNAVTSAKIRNGQVRTGDIRNNAVNTFKVRNGSLLAADFAPGQLPAGPGGAGRPASPPGPAGAVGPITVRTGDVSIGGGVAHNGQYGTGDVTVNCASGEKAISAGAGWSGTDANRELWIQRLEPIVNGGNVTGYKGTGGNDSGGNSTFTLYVLCYKG